MRSRIIVLSLGLLACSILSVHAQKARPAIETANNEYGIGAVLFTQKAAEYRALAYQAFNIARAQLDADLDKENVKRLPKPERNRPRAIAVDIDETVLDNSPNQAQRIINKTPYTRKDRHASQAANRSKAVPGAVDFISYAVSKGVKVFYISNRDEVQMQATVDNLKAAGFPDVSPENVLLRGSVGSKEPRRKKIAETYRLVLLMGDNLDDFSDVFERRSTADRFAETDRVRDLWGKRFIVVPNAMYGTWENAIYGYEPLTEAQKAEKRAEALELP
jgi:5'-nucleotidase (lipoprotein e(P4) family)